VLDEADRMLDMGFQDAITDIVQQTPKTRQTLLFSATYPDAIETLSAAILRDPVSVSLDTQHTPRQIEQIFFETEPAGRTAALLKLLEHYRPASCIVFCNTKQQCQELAGALGERGFGALALHGDLEQKERDQVLVRFANKSCGILLATDVAARGLDIKDLAAVVNFELSRDAEVHVHRIGRTGRAGATGLALSLYTPAEARRINSIETYMGVAAPLGDLGSLTGSATPAQPAPMVTLCIDGGRKDKLRAGDILGALTGANGIAGTEVGKIDIFDFHAYVAVTRSSVTQALRCLGAGKIKGRPFKARRVD